MLCFSGGGNDAGYFIELMHREGACLIVTTRKNEKSEFLCEDSSTVSTREATDEDIARIAPIIIGIDANTNQAELDGIMAVSKLVFDTETNNYCEEVRFFDERFGPTNKEEKLRALVLRHIDKVITGLGSYCPA